MQFEHNQISSSFPHTGPQTEWRIISIDGIFGGRIRRDSAGQNILSLFHTMPGHSYRPQWRVPAHLFGGIERSFQDDAEIQENGEADERGDDSHIEGYVGGAIGDSEDAINEEEHDSGSGDDESSEGSGGAPRGAARHRNPQVPRPPRSPAGEAPASEAAQGSNFTLKRQNATSQHSTPPVILQSSLCIWRR